MKKRILGSLTLWLAAVVSVATLASLAIDTAGRQVTAGAIAAPLPRDLTAPTTRPPSPSTATERPGPSPAATPSTHRPKRPAARPTTAAPTERKRPAASKSAAHRPVTSTYSTTGGRLKVACQGPWVTLDGGFALPAPDWAVKVLSDGPASVMVVFGNGKVGIMVVAVCVEGSPRFSKSEVQIPVRTDGPGPGSGGHGFFSR